MDPRMAMHSRLPCRTLEINICNGALPANPDKLWLRSQLEARWCLNARQTREVVVCAAGVCCGADMLSGVSIKYRSTLWWAQV